jgi:hypothetical protein
MPQTNEATRMDLTPIPEPSRWLMWLAALPVLLWMARRRGEF